MLTMIQEWYVLPYILSFPFFFPGKRSNKFLNWFIYSWMMLLFFFHCKCVFNMFYEGMLVSGVDLAACTFWPFCSPFHASNFGSSPSWMISQNLILVMACSIHDFSKSSVFICSDELLSSWSFEQIQVEPKKLSMLSNWQRVYTMEHILTQLKKEMAAPHNRKLVQPPEGTFF